jgi:putative Mn2+ efflux pump MntP
LPARRAVGQTQFYKDAILTAFQIFIIRALMGLGMSVVLVRMFHQSSNPVYIGGLAVILVGLAYFMEYLRKRKRD